MRWDIEKSASTLKRKKGDKKKKILKIASLSQIKEKHDETNSVKSIFFHHEKVIRMK